MNRRHVLIPEEPLRRPYALGPFLPSFYRTDPMADATLIQDQSANSSTGKAPRFRMLGQRKFVNWISPALAITRIHQYLENSGHHLAEKKVSLFIPLRGKLTGAGITANGIYTVVAAYAKKALIEVDGPGCMGSEQPLPPTP